MGRMKTERGPEFICLIYWKRAVSGDIHRLLKIHAA